jgi:hypothetical protein
MKRPRVFSLHGVPHAAETRLFGSGDLGEPFKCTAESPWTPEVSKTHKLILHPDAGKRYAQLTPTRRDTARTVACPHCGIRWEAGT